MNPQEDAKALFFAGMAAVQAKDYVGAEEKLRASLELVPGRLSVLVNLAGVLFYQDRPDEAADAAMRATAIDPNNVEGWLILARARHRQGRPAEALQASDHLIALRPDDADYWSARGGLLAALFRFSDAAYAYERALALKPGIDQPTIEGEFFHARMRACEWHGLTAVRADIIAGLNAGRRACLPFPMLSFADDPRLQLLSAGLAVAHDFPEKLPRWQGEHYRHARTRIAYISPDFREHPVANLTAGLFEQHDKTRFETIGIAVGRADSSAMRARLAASFDTFHDGRAMSDSGLSAWIRDAEVDILVDLAAHTDGGRLGVLAERPAPVQVSYLGHPGTSGAPYIDYLIADNFVVPVASEADYSEKIVRLPDCFQANDDRRPVPVLAPPRDLVGLPPTGFVFCSFNNTYKINPEFFAIWMRLLKAVPDSVLWLVADEDSARAHRCGGRPCSAASPGIAWCSPDARSTANTSPGYASPTSSWTRCRSTPGLRRATFSGPACQWSPAPARVTRRAWPEAC